ncbi:Predicted ATPase [Amycolatopsis marina]|uniref:Predicted ATPase n=1 Tax=Amycolatopsis marina TaxID=490629 RepID=A0A1I1C5Q1_9PSEU|nr:BTAD domain-containing putative transcriptional regulator [Amycolatopsis marina]SFB56238.1 Predicted ATPase [Amycolatopsis marina]
MRFGVLGPLTVWRTDGDLVRVPELKVRALLADLLLHEGRVVSADRLAEDLWGARRPANPANTLQTKISQLRRTLEDAEPGGRALVVHQPPGYLLRLGPDSLDLHRFRSLVERARDTEDPPARAALLTDALALWRGPALADFGDEPFAVAAIQRWTEDRLAAVELRAEARLSLGEHAALTGELGDLVALHPLRERLRALQMRALYRAGRQSEALDSFADVRQRLATELGLEPGPELTEMHQAILRQDTQLAESTEPAPLRARPRTNLPAALTELIGRSDAVRTVRSLMTGSRLVTLTGPGGVGKTRLAIEAAAELTDKTADGVWLVEFAGLDRHACQETSPHSGEWVLEAVATALGVREDPATGPLPAAVGGDLMERLTDAVRDKDLLLVLDNCEQVVASVAALAERLLRVAPGLRMLATSQEALGLTGEVIWTVPPLRVPMDAGTSADRATDPVASARMFSAVRLLEARAAAAVPGFILDADSAPVVAAICRRLDGIPLALELAATRVRVLGVHELLARLDDRFRLLDAPRRGAPARQRTLRAMIDWSWELLSEAEQAVLRRLAVHAEGCDLDAAEAVCAGAGVEPAEVLDLLARLVERSLVVCHQQGAQGPRYRLLESVAAYCLERVREAGELARVRERHSRFYTDLAERAEHLLRGPGQRAWLNRLDAETGNVRAALDTAVQRGDADLALRLVNSMTWFWFLRGRIGEARRSLHAAIAVGAASDDARSSAVAMLEGLAVLDGASADAAAIELARKIDDPATRARALWFLGYVTSTVADLTTGQQLTEAALAEFEAVGDDWGIAAALSDRSSQAMAKGELALAAKYAASSGELFGRLGDRWGQLQASFALGTLAELRGDYAEAARLHRAGLGMAEDLRLWPEVSFQLSWLGRIFLLSGDFDQAKQFHERALRLAVDHGFKPGEMYAETGLALGARRQGDLDAAERHLHSVLEWNRAVDFEPGNSLILAELGFVAELRGDAEVARRRQLEGLAIARRSGDPRALALAYEGLAGALALAAEHAAAARLLGSATRMRAGVGAPLPEGERGDVDRITRAVRTALGEPTFVTEFEQEPHLTPG